MSFSLGPKGGIQDPHILRLLSELTPIVKQHGAKGAETIAFIEKHATVTTVDLLNQQMYTFKEIAEPLSILIQGIKIEQPDLAGDAWKNGSAEDMFDNKDPTDTADFWK